MNGRYNTVLNMAVGFWNNAPKLLGAEDSLSWDLSFDWDSCPHKTYILAIIRKYKTRRNIGNSSHQRENRGWDEYQVEPRTCRHCLWDSQRNLSNTQEFRCFDLSRLHRMESEITWIKSIIPHMEKTESQRDEKSLFPPGLAFKRK